MSLITTTYIKQNFPEWEKFCDVPGSDLSPGEFLNNMLISAEGEFGQYITTTETDITDNEKRILLNIVRKNCFDLRHGDTAFEHKPQIVKDYETTIELLDKFRLDGFSQAKASDIKMTAKDKKFDVWFTDQ